MSKLENVLSDQFGYQQFRPGQKQIMEELLKKRSVFVILPTGGGKSLLYQLPSLIMEGTTIVISPLISLMEDQVANLQKRWIKAEYLSSNRPKWKKMEIGRRIIKGDLDLLYLSPEKLFFHRGAFLKILQKANVSLIAIDEAHCISKWGYDFRPNYLKLSKIKEFFPNIPIIALTATADKRTQEDIVKRIFSAPPRKFLYSFNRPNIFYRFQRVLSLEEEGVAKLISYLQNHFCESGIIYVRTRHQVERIALLLKGEGFAAEPYHAGLSNHIRLQSQKLFQQGEAKIIVATTAFGLGIDKSNIRFVIHFGMPQDIEDYYQQTGRAGRDRQKSEALLFFSLKNRQIIWNLLMREGEQEQRDIKLEKFGQMTALCQTRKCRRQFILHYFGEEFPDHCGSCDRCCRSGDA
jgi:ATP-dependent DNA helicase RecQ